jgi:hypothetical protein
MWTTTQIAGRSADVFTPERPRFVLLFLPDIDGITLRDNETWTTLLQQHSLACVVPDGGEGWWLDVIYPPFHETLTPENYLLEELLPWLTATFGERTFALTGVGMGGQGALRMGFRHPEPFKIVAGLNSYVDFQDAYGSSSSLDTIFTSREQARLATPILQIQARCPTHLWFACDPNSAWHRGNDRLASKLTALGENYSADLETSTCGHSWNYYDCMAPRLLRFVAEALEKESRRLM